MLGRYGASTLAKASLFVVATAAAAMTVVGDPDDEWGPLFQGARCNAGVPTKPGAIYYGMPHKAWRCWQANVTRQSACPRSFDVLTRRGTVGS